MSSNPSRAPIYFRLRRPIRAAGFGGTTGSLCLAMNVIMFIELYFDFMSVFMYFYPHVVSRFLSVPLLVRVVQTCHRRVCLRPATNLGSLSYFLAWGLVFPNGSFSEKLMLNGGSRVCGLLSLVIYPKRVYFSSLTLTAEYWGSGRYMPLNKVIIIT
jgi:hypothetical protein